MTKKKHTKKIIIKNKKKLKKMDNICFIHDELPDHCFVSSLNRNRMNWAFSMESSHLKVANLYKKIMVEAKLDSSGDICKIENEKTKRINDIYEEIKKENKKIEKCFSERTKLTPDDIEKEQRKILELFIRHNTEE
jgi:hypothetical protein